MLALEWTEDLQNLLDMLEEMIQEKKKSAKKVRGGKTEDTALKNAPEGTCNLPDEKKKAVESLGKQGGMKIYRLKNISCS